MHVTAPRLRNTLRALIAASVLAVLLPVGSDAASAATVASSWAQGFASLPAVPGSLASGVLTNSGAPSPGATIVLFGQPVQPDGSAVALSRSVTDDDGSWSIGAPPEADLSAFTDPLSGVANFFVQAFGGTGSTMYYFSAQSTAAPSAATKLAAAGTSTVRGTQRALTVDPAATRSIRLDSSHGAYTRVSTPAPTAPQKSGGPVTVCGDKVLGTYDNLKTFIGYSADEAANTSAVHLTFSRGASSSLGVGISAGGAFSASGTGSITSSITASFPATHNVAYVNYYAYATYKWVRHTCVTGSVASSYESFRPAYYDGGFTYESAPRIAMGHCTGVSARTTVTKSTTRAYQVSGGVNAGSVIGINLSAQTGYSTQVSIDYYTGDYGHPWCGLSAMPDGNNTSRLQTLHPGVWRG